MLARNLALITLIFLACACSLDSKRTSSSAVQDSVVVNPAAGFVSLPITTAQDIPSADPITLEGNDTYHFNLPPQLVPGGPSHQPDNYLMHFSNHIINVIAFNPENPYLSTMTAVDIGETNTLQLAYPRYYRLVVNAGSIDIFIDGNGAVTLAQDSHSQPPVTLTSIELTEIAILPPATSETINRNKFAAGTAVAVLAAQLDNSRVDLVSFEWTLKTSVGNRTISSTLPIKDRSSRNFQPSFSQARITFDVPTAGENFPTIGSLVFRAPALLPLAPSFLLAIDVSQTAWIEGLPEQCEYNNSTPGPFGAPSTNWQTAPSNDSTISFARILFKGAGPSVKISVHGNNVEPNKYYLAQSIALTNAVFSSGAFSVSVPFTPVAGNTTDVEMPLGTDVIVTGAQIGSAGDNLLTIKSSVSATPYFQGNIVAGQDFSVRAPAAEALSFELNGSILLQPAFSPNLGSTFVGILSIGSSAPVLSYSIYQKRGSAETLLVSGLSKTSTYSVLPGLYRLEMQLSIIGGASVESKIVEIKNVL